MPEEVTHGSEQVEAHAAEWIPWAILGALLAAGTAGSVLIAHSGRAAAARAVSAPGTNTARVPARVAPASSKPGAGDERISVMHLVVAYSDTGMAKALGITRTRAAAQERAEEALGRARKGEDFGKLVVEYSEEPRARETKGQLANFRRKDAIPSFAEAAFALRPGQLSEVVDTPFGYMVIERTQ